MLFQWTVLIFATLYSATLAIDELPTKYKLMDTLFKGYDPRIRPVYSDKTDTTVMVQFRLYKLLDVDEIQQTIKLSLAITAMWKDKLLNWNPSEYDNITIAQVSPDRIWKPSLQPYNSVGNIKDPNIHHIYASVRFDGRVTLISHAIYELDCELDLTEYPYDENNCSIRMYYAPENIKLNLFMTNAAGKDNLTSTEFDVIITDGKAEGDFASVQITIKRSPTFFTSTVLTPFAIILMLTLVAFILPPDSEAKLDLLMTILVTYTLLLAFYQQQFPQARKVNRQVRLMTNTFIVLVIQIAIVAVTTRMSRISNLSIHPKLFKAAKLMGMFVLLPYHGSTCTAKVGTIGKNDTSDNETAIEELADASASKVLQQLQMIVQWLDDLKSQGDLQSQWNYIGALADRLIFIIIAITTLSYYFPMYINAGQV